MKEYIFSIPIPIFIVLVIILVIAIVIVALKGHITAKFGDKIVNIGGAGDKDLKPPETIIITQKRSCGDCILLLMGEREKLEFKLRKKTNKIMKAQMTFVEQKLIEIQTALLNDVTGKIKETSINESIQYKLIYGLLKDALHKLKDEIRRSFNDNGFWDISAPEFSSYLKDRRQILNSMLVHYIRNMYPDREGITKTAVIIEIIETRNPFISGLINDLYMYAREVKVVTDREVREAQETFTTWVDEFIN